MKKHGERRKKYNQIISNGNKDSMIESYNELEISIRKKYISLCKKRLIIIKKEIN